MRASILIAVFAGSMALLEVSSMASDDPIQNTLREDRLIFELVGQVTNFATPPPLGSSNQYGYLTKVRGIDDVFSGNPHDETTAITEASEFTLNGSEFRLGRRGQTFRVTLTGHLNALAPPTGFFSGYAGGQFNDQTSAYRQ